MINISDLFTEDFILLDVDINSKDELFKAAAEHLYSKNIVNDKELFIKALYDRESIGETGVGDGFAIPHAKSEAVNKPAVLYIKSNRKIEYESLDDLPIDNLAKRIEKIHSQYITDPIISKILLSPLTVTGQLKSLVFTHNSWFINEVLVKLNLQNVQLIDFDLSPALFFNHMKFEMWMDNGFELPPSAKANQFLQQNKSFKIYE